MKQNKLPRKKKKALKKARKAYAWKYAKEVFKYSKGTYTAGCDPYNDDPNLTMYQNIDGDMSIVEQMIPINDRIKRSYLKIQHAIEVEMKNNPTHLE